MATKIGTRRLSAVSQPHPRLEALEARQLLSASPTEAAFTSSPITSNEQPATLAAMTPGDHHMGMHAELGALLPTQNADITAQHSGNWTDTQTWGGSLPQAGDLIHIPANIQVQYNAFANTSYQGIRIDTGAALTFQTNINTRLVLDTLVAMPGSSLVIGSDTNPIRPDVTAEILIDASAGPITDPTRLGRGVLTHGFTSIVGADKADHLPLHIAPRAGDDQLVIRGDAQGWRPGDRIVLNGTQHDPNGNDQDNTRFHDEILEITSIERTGQRLAIVTFINRTNPSADGSSQLLWDHTPPQGFDDHNLRVYAANLTRNITIQTLNADNVPTQERGHTMFMHAAEVTIRNAAFYDLGRTDKNRLIDDPVENVNGTIGNATNPRGRYALHLHLLGGIDNPAPSATRAFITGNAVWGSPGWGIVQHGTHAGLEDNVVFDVVGTAIASEDGNEVGWWTNNITIKTTGDDNPLQDFDGSDRVPLFDFGFNGEGFWIQGAGQIRLDGNIAASAASTGIMLFSNVDGMRNVKIPASVLDDPNITQGRDEVDAFNVPARGIFNSTVINADFGLVTWGHMRNQDGELGFTFGLGTPAHRLRTTIDGFNFWSIYGEGIFTQYTSQTDFSNGLILGNTEDPVDFRWGINGEGRGRGIAANNAAKNLTYDSIHIEGFEIGIRAIGEGVSSADDTTPARASAFSLTNSLIRNVEIPIQLFGGFSSSQNENPGYYLIDNVHFESNSPENRQNVIAAFNSTQLTSHGYEFNASDAFSPDPRAPQSTGVVSYLWDFDSDGTIDDHGRVIRHNFSELGTHDVTLTIIDSAGVATSTTETIVALPTQSYDPILNGDFNNPQAIYTYNGWRSGSIVDEGFGWIDYGFNLENGRAVKDVGYENFPDISRTTSQVVRDQFITHGTRQLTIQAGSIQQVGPDNQLRIAIYGTNAQDFGMKTWSADPPVPTYGVQDPETFLLFEASDLVDGTMPTTSFDFTVDFNQGYEFLVFIIEGSNTNVSAGDQLWIDSITLTDPQSTLTILTDPPPTAALGIPYTHQLQADATADLSLWASITALPPGLNMDNQGLITGTPTEPGTFTFDVIAIDANGDDATAAFNLTIINSPAATQPGLLQTATITSPPPTQPQQQTDAALSDPDWIETEEDNQPWWLTPA
ncbi:putative Ig domain-containing protein [Mucisphaera sp.]|uniref:putative Ig domain-containing protein n=1 Tax=Mucisphaera sp. TaxID=2913024 RepID=UPI003D0F6A0E